MPWSYLSYWYMSDHPVAGRGIGGFQCQVGAHGRAERADGVLDMRGTRAFGGRLGIDDIAAVRSEERREGKECVSQSRYRGSAYHEKQQTRKHTHKRHTHRLRHQ